jgi:hypothetical protein
MFEPFGLELVLLAPESQPDLGIGVAAGGGFARFIEQ